MFESERRDLAWVPRWSIVRCNRRQSVAEHSYFVACYGLEIAKRIGWAVDDPSRRLALVVYLLRHDEDETLTGDIPGPIKRLCGFHTEAITTPLHDTYGEAPFVDDDMKAIRRVADLMDECMYLAGEMNSGNQHVKSCLRSAKNRLDKAVAELPCKSGLAINLHTELLDVIKRELTYVKDYSGFAGI